MLPVHSEGDLGIWAICIRCQREYRKAGTNSSATRDQAARMDSALAEFTRRLEFSQR